MAILGHSKHYEEIASSATADLARFTLGNFDSAARLSPQVCGLFENLGLLSSSDGCTVSAAKASNIIVAFECISIAATVLAFVWLRLFRPKEDRDVGMSSLGADAFTVYFPWAPPTADQTAPELRKHIEKCLFEFSGEHHQVREVALIENSFSLIDLFQSVGALRRQLERLQTLHAQLRWERGDVWRHGSLGQYDARAAKEGFDFRSDPEYTIGAAEGGALCCCATRSQRIERVEGDMLRVAAEQKALKHQAMEETKRGQQLHSFAVRGAFVTFETLKGKELAQHVFADKGSFACCRPANLRLHYEELGQPKSRIPRAKKAPPPDVINWPSFALSGTSVTMRRCSTFFASLAVVLLSFVMTIGASVSQRALQVPALDCPPLTPPGISAPVNSTLASEIGMDCVCAAVPWNDLDLDAMKAHGHRADCTDEFCPALVARSFAELQNAQDCQDWLGSYITLSSLTVVAALVTVGINLLLVVCMNRLVQWEAHKSKSSANKSYSERLFTMQFLNMVGVPLIVNAAFTMPEDLQVIQGEAFHDTVPRWYATVGSALVLTTLLNAFIPHAIVFVQYLRLRCRRSADTAASQTDLNLSFVGPEWNPAKRVAQLMNTVAVCMIFAPSIPLLSLIGVCSVVLFYWVEVWAFARVQRTPPHYNTQLLKLTNAMLPIILGRIMFALWSLGSPSVLDTDAVFGDSFLRSADDGGSCEWAVDMYEQHDTNDGSSISLGSIWAGLVIRMCNGHLLPLWVLAVLLVLAAAAVFVTHSCGRGLLCVAHTLTCGTCDHTGQAKRKHKKHLYASTFSQLAQQPRDGSRALLSGSLSYNILHNDGYKQQFGYDSKFLNGQDGTGLPIKQPGWRPRGLLDLQYFDAMAATGSVALARRRRRSRAASPASPAAALAASPPPLSFPHDAADGDSEQSSDDEFREASSRNLFAPQGATAAAAAMDCKAPAPHAPERKVVQSAWHSMPPPVPNATLVPMPAAQQSAAPGAPLRSGIIVDDSSSASSGSGSGSDSGSASSSVSSSDGDDVFSQPPAAAANHVQGGAVSSRGGGSVVSRGGGSSASASTPELLRVPTVHGHSAHSTPPPSDSGSAVAALAPPLREASGGGLAFTNPLRQARGGAPPPPMAPENPLAPHRARNALSGYFAASSAANGPRRS